MDRDTAQALLDLLNPLHGALDDQISDEVVREELEIPKDYEHHVVITPQMERDLTRAVLILEKLKMTEKVKSWWSGDGQWFCMLVNDGVNQATVSLTPEEAVILSKAADESATPAVERARKFFWKRAAQYDREKLQATYNDVLAMQDQTDQVPLATALDAVGAALAATD